MVRKLLYLEKKDVQEEFEVKVEKLFVSMPKTTRWAKQHLRCVKGGGKIHAAVGIYNNTVCVLGELTALFAGKSQDK